MVVKALSEPLRELVIHDPKAVSEFMNLYTDVLTARVKIVDPFIRHPLTNSLIRLHKSQYLNKAYTIRISTPKVAPGSNVMN